MDMESTPQFTNILNVIGTKATDEKLSAADRVENYNLLEKLNAQGIKLADLMKKAEQNTPKEDDAELFSLMEVAVKDDAEVKSARQKVVDVKSAVLAKICYQHPEYRAAIDEYRAVVSRTYKQRAVEKAPFTDVVEEITLTP